MEELINYQIVLKEMISKVLAFLPKIGMSLLIFIAFLVCLKIVQKIVKKISESNKVDPDLILFLNKIIKYGILGIAITTSLGTIGIDVTTFVAGVGVTGFALGFAMKDTVSNLISGILVIVYKPFRRNDYIEMSRGEGRVKGIDLRYTVLEKENGDLVYIPNSALFTNIVVVKDDDVEKEELKLSSQAIER